MINRIDRSWFLLSVALVCMVMTGVPAAGWAAGPGGELEQVVEIPKEGSNETTAESPEEAPGEVTEKRAEKSPEEGQQEGPEKSAEKSPEKGSEAAITGPEGVKWLLKESGGEAVALPGDAEQPYILFDPVEKKTTGYSGCNSFFGSYELEGSSLTIGPVAATRRDCEEPASGVEKVFLNVLENAGRWEVTDSELRLLAEEEVIARFVTKKSDEPVHDIGSMTFLLPWVESGKVTLSRGEFRTPASADPAPEMVVKLTDKMVFGMVGGTEIGVVVLATSESGAGTFYDLAFLSREGGGWVNTDTVMLGYRAKVSSVDIADDHIVVFMMARRPNDPGCCPSVEVMKRFTVKGKELFQAKDE